jgi:class 3 adenylate cyclase
MLRRRAAESRRLATVLFTDIVGSTQRAVDLGDREWRRVLRRHHELIRGALRRFGGREVDTAGDGFFATFDQPAQAVRCALEAREAVAGIGLTIRAGIHTGEVEPMGDKVGGVAVHLGARLLSAADPGEILVTSTVRDLVAGSELVFVDAGARELKGLPGEWRVYSATGPTPSVAVAPEAPRERAGVAPGRRALVVAGLLGAAVGIGALLAIGLGGRSGGSAAPDTVLTIDMSTNGLGQAVRVGRGPVAVVADVEAAWAASESGTLTRIDTEDGSTQTIGGIGVPTAVGIGDGMVWVAQGYGRRVSLVDVATADVRQEIDVHARRLAIGADAAWLADDLADTVLRVPFVGLQPELAAQLEPASGPRGIGVEASGVWVVAARADVVAQLDAASGEVRATVGLPDPAEELAIGAGGVWLTSRETDRVLRIDPTARRVSATIEACDGPDAIAAAADAVWVACSAARALWRLDADGSIVARIALPAVPSAIAIGDGEVWVALRAS